MKKIFFLFITSGMLLFSACDNSLDETVYSDLLENGYQYTADEVYNVIAPVYSNMRSFYTVTINYFMTQECSADIAVLAANSSGWDNAGLWRHLHQHTWNSEHDQIKAIWTPFYSGVIHANRIINQLESGQIPITDDLKKSIIAEMKVARAFYNWLIMDNFGDAILLMGVSQDIPGITSRSEIYNAVISDLKEAIPDLSEDTSKKMYARFNKWAAKALLANIYLNSEVYTGTAKWTECLAECNDIINAGKYSLESDYFSNFKILNENSKENIFTVPFDEWNSWSGGVAPQLAFLNFSLHSSSKATLNLESSPWGAGGFKANPQFIDSYDPADLRLKGSWFMGPQFAADGVTPVYCAYEKKGQQLIFTKELPDGIYTAENEGYRMKKYEIRNGNPLFMGNDVVFFRYGQVLMMKAECLLRSGQKDQAAQIVTQIRQRAFTDPAKATVTGAQLEGNTCYNYGYVENYKIVDKGDQSAVKYGRFLDELGWEFALENFRRRDLIRFGVFTTKSWLSHRPNGAYRTVFPIPQSALDSNPKLVQNPNYQ